MNALLLVAAAPLVLRVQARRIDGATPWWLTAPARLVVTAIAMVAWIYWCGVALTGSDAAIAKLLGWLVLAVEAASAGAAADVTPSRRGGDRRRPRGAHPAARRKVGETRPAARTGSTCPNCGAWLRHGPTRDRVRTHPRDSRPAPPRPRRDGA